MLGACLAVAMKTTIEKVRLMLWNARPTIWMQGAC